MTDKTYLYGVVGDVGDGELAAVGVDGVSPVRLISCDGLGAVVSAHRETRTVRELDTEALLNCLVVHQRVLEHVLTRRVVLPVRFGTVLDAEADVRHLLLQNGRLLAEAFASIRDKLEVEVTATWEVSDVLREIGREPAVANARQGIEQSGHTSLADRLSLGQLVNAQLEARRQVIRDRIIESLKPLCREVAVHPLLDDRMVMNVAFLIDRSREAAFEEELRRLDTLFQGRIAFRLVGPLPPHSFYTVEVARVTVRAAEEARRLLSLDGGVPAAAEVTRAYGRLAGEARHKFGMDGTARRLELLRLKEARDLLLRYYDRKSGGRGDEAGQQDRWCVQIRPAAGNDIAPSSFGGGALTYATR